MTTIARQNLKRCYGTKPNVQDVLPAAKRNNLSGLNGVSFIRTTPQLSKGLHYWNIADTGSDAFRYVSMDNNGQLRIVLGNPNPDFGPNLFQLQPGRQAGQHMIYTYAMVPSNNSKLYALTVVKDVNGQYNLKYSNKDGYDYDWSFTQHDVDDNYAITWCGSNTSDKNFVLYLDNDVLKLASYPSNKALQSEHFISNFCPTR